MGVVNYIWDDVNDSLLEEVDDSGNVIASYTNKPGPFGKVISQERNGVASYYHYDGQGSTVALTDDNENVTDTYVYNAFGETVASTGTTENPFRYVGQYGYYTDSETNDIDVRARNYLPAVGRWSSRDPIGYHATSNSLYEYCRDNPARFLDPMGMQIMPPASPSGPTMPFFPPPPTPSDPCSGGDRGYALSRCWLPCLFNCNNPWKQDNTGSYYQEAIDWAGTIVPISNTNPNPVANQALRHCYASARMACDFWSDCGCCLMNAREDFQGLCGGQSPFITARTKRNNDVGIGIGQITCEPEKQKRLCLRKYMNGELDITPGPGEQQGAPFPVPNPVPFPSN